MKFWVWFLLVTGVVLLGMMFSAFIGSGDNSCTKRGGVYVRGIIGYECVQRARSR